MHYVDSELLSFALQRYYSANELPLDGGANDPWARYSFGPIKAIAFPNFNLRVEALRRHDIHHILNNLDTSPVDEGLIAAWELGSGCGYFWISWFMESQALWWGLLLAPKKTLHLFALGRKSQNFFHLEIETGLYNKTVGELRSKMIPKDKIIVFSFGDFLLLGLAALLGVLCMSLFIPTILLFTIFGFFIGANQKI